MRSKEHTVETETILNKLRELMNARNWSVSQLAENADLSAGTIYPWFNKGVHPTPESLDKICKVFGLTINEFYAVDYDELIKAKVDKLIEECKNLNEKQIDFLILTARMLKGQD
ncbi:MAG: hypothetical protein DBY05_01815 [Clostridiales bacterium]|jgi:transcriptional regulator with XRE-family HTH domain|nr:MAG: hypothetical protein DBY05_01815 [Clostridiales bacterium]